VTLADLMPARIGFLTRPTRKPRHPQHRAIDEVDRQLFLRTGADLLIQGLRLQLEDQDARHAETVARIDKQHAAVVRDLEQQLAALRERLGIAFMAETAATRTQELSLDDIRQHCVMPLDQARDAGLLGAVTNPGRVHTAT